MAVKSILYTKRKIRTVNKEKKKKIRKKRKKKKRKKKVQVRFQGFSRSVQFYKLKTIFSPALQSNNNNGFFKLA